MDSDPREQVQVKEKAIPLNGSRVLPVEASADQARGATAVFAYLMGIS